ncbi:MAG: hypothetical protein ACLGPL_11120 [Acidobacteriota bacterium]
MNEVNRRLQREAERIAAKHPLPEFYSRFKAQISLARKLYFNDPTVALVREAVQPALCEDLGHGIFHSSRVSMDCATLVFIELQDNTEAARSRMERLMVLALIAGLLHDIRRCEENHAEAGAREAEVVLADFPLKASEVRCITQAIRNHEAFCEVTATGPSWCRMVSDCLYDADKFRWGPDTFTHTLWHMADHQGLTPRELIGRFPWGMTGVYRIAGTFRTVTGRQYGPEIIETGAEIGKEIYRYLLQHYKVRDE